MTVEQLGSTGSIFILVPLLKVFVRLKIEITTESVYVSEVFTPGRKSTYSFKVQTLKTSLA